jgi:hypothetical protein
MIYLDIHLDSMLAPMLSSSDTHATQGNVPSSDTHLVDGPKVAGALAAGDAPKDTEEKQHEEGEKNFMEHFENFQETCYMVLDPDHGGWRTKG